MAEPGDGEILVRNVFVPVDPGMRPVLSDVRVGVDEFEPVPIGSLVGYMTVGQVVASRVEGFTEGDWVTDMMMWQDYAVTGPRTARKIETSQLSPTAALGILGVPGLSAWSGLKCLASPKAGETVVITSAAGTVGMIAGQIARNLGCHTVGVAGGAVKCRFLTEKLGFNSAIDYHDVPDVAAAVRAACPHGVDVLFDNVGNAMVDAILPLMALGGRIVICGQIADYHLPPADRPAIRNTNCFVTRRLTMRGLFVYDHAPLFPQAITELSAWTLEGKLRLHETIIDGFDQLPTAFARLFTGAAMGRTIVRIDRD
jgi:NADPH-dependent curcumin reductase CurA